MKPPKELHKVEPCDLCGAHGLAETVFTCCRCNLNRHGYCMGIYIDIIPKVWLCESCQSKHVSTSPCKVNQDIGSWASKRPRASKTGKVKFLQLDEVIELSSQKAPAVSRNVTFSITPKSNPQISPPKVPGTLPRNDEVHKKPMTNQNASCPLAKGPKTECIGDNQLSPHGVIPDKKAQTHHSQNEKPTKGTPFEVLSARKSSPIVGSGPKTECIGDNQLSPRGVIPDKKAQTHHPQNEKPTKGTPFEVLSARKSSPIVGSGGILSEDAECNQSSVGKSDLQSFQKNLNLLRKFLPSSIHAWRGQIQILQSAASSEIYDGFEAQPPCIVNKKAYKFSREMPSLLQLETLPALNFLTDIFRDDSPKLQDIALYFFPSEHTERSRKNLNSILKFMNAKKSMLRSYIDGVELLVFTSNLLDMDSRGAIAAANAGHFLWGVFRQKKTDKAVERVPPDMEPVDMDVDMIGGNDVVGRADRVRKDKPKSASKMEYYNKLDVPPGFEAFAKMS